MHPDTLTRSTRRLLALGLAAGLAACGSDAPAGPEPPNGEDPVATTSVAVRDNVFVPMHITVSPEATVTWTWEGSQFHNVTWVSADLADSETQTAGSHEVMVPAETGQLAYYCTVHGTPTSGMRGSVTVE
jgi:plastocyanin